MKSDIIPQKQQFDVKKLFTIFIYVRSDEIMTVGEF